VKRSAKEKKDTNGHTQMLDPTCQQVQKLLKIFLLELNACICKQKKHHFLNNLT
jgi:hypothetical protein